MYGSIYVPLNTINYTTFDIFCKRLQDKYLLFYFSKKSNPPAYPFKADGTDRQWRFSMSDPIMKCNQGSFLLTISKDGKGKVKRISEECEDKISMQTMTTMLMGYKRPDYLAKIGRIQADEETIDMLEDAIEQQAPYISDYF